MEIKNKKILIFYPYGATKHYGKSIADELKRRGATVHEYDERPSQNSLVKIIIRLFKQRIPYFFLFYINKIIKNDKNVKFDYILILRGEAFSPLVVQRLRKAFPHAYFILYLWDILEVNDLRTSIPLFDKALTFDLEDSRTMDNLFFRPTFYLPDYERRNNEVNTKEKYDILYICTLNKDRYITLKRIKDYLITMNISFKFYLYIPSVLLYFRDRLLNRDYVKLRDVDFSPLSLKDSIKDTWQSKVILDINYPTQKSLSMRAFEALAAGKKYITTNSEIRKYDFYNEMNILIIDKNNPIIPKEFITTSFSEISEEILRKYSLSQWVDDVFS